MSPFSRPLIGLSLTESDEGVSHYTSMLAKMFHWTDVHFLHVVSPDDSRTWNPQPWQEKLEAEVARLFDSSALDCRTTSHITEGSRLDGLLEMAARHDRDLIVLGHRRTRSGRRSLARRTAMAAPASVWLVPEGSPPKISELLVPTDFSTHSADSLSVAIDIAQAARLEQLRALHVFFDPSTVRYDEHLEEILGKEEQHFQEHLEGVETHGISVEPIYHESTQPSQAILRVAQRCGSDLIVMNTRGRSRAAFVMLGSTTSETMASTTVPVVAVKHHGSRMTLMQALLSGGFWEGVPKTN